MAATRRETVSFLSVDDGTPVASMSLFGDETLQRIEAPLDEEPVQIVENGRYEYELDSRDLTVVATYGGAVVRRSANPALPHCGTITPGSHVGRLSLDAMAANGACVGRAAIEVRSRKLAYRDDYRRMLEDIAEHSIGLVSDLHSPVTGTVVPDSAGDAPTLQHQFEFLRALIGSSSFREAVHRVAQHPYRRRENQEREARDLRRSGRVDRGALRSLGMGARRFAVPPGHPLRTFVESLPQTISAARILETEDTAENRFVKFIIETFAAFVTKMQVRLETLHRPSDGRLIASVRALAAELRALATLDAFRRVGPPSFLPYRSVVMQRREGYREILRAWIHFHVGVRLVWSGGDDVYASGRRDVATLYEYWVFFRLLRIAQRTFRFDPPVHRELLASTPDGFGLRLRQNQQIDLVGTLADHTRLLRVRFSYNRRFDTSSDRGVAGSWTLPMRPDFTFSFWPAEFTESEAEEQELMVHLHFDAKYRVDNLTEIFQASDGDDPVTASATSAQRSDLLKMHAYRDAIRRSHGAYVIYPGERSHECRGYHEVLPGLGAFVARPSGTTDDLAAFIADVARHTSDRATARERQTFHSFEVHREQPRFEVRRRMPERDENGARMSPPAETFVLVGWVRDENHLAWVKRERMYNFRMDARSGSLRLTADVVAARYLVLHYANHLFVDGLFEITSDGPRVFARDELLRRAYPSTPGADNYLVYDVRPAADFMTTSWNGARFAKWPHGRRSAAPFTVRLDELLSIAS